MKRIILIAAAVMFTGSAVPEAQAQFSRGHGHFQLGRGLKLGIQGNRLNRFQGGFIAPSVGSTLFDLYRTEQIPVPPYFSLHPPVYYNGIDYQRYGTTPFAYPYTWWQQFGYGYNHGPPPVSAAGPTAATPAVIENPHATKDSPPQKSKNSDAKVAAVIVNPFVSDNPAGFDDVGPLIVANRHLPTTPTLDDSAK